MYLTQVGRRGAALLVLVSGIVQQQDCQVTLCAHTHSLPLDPGTHTQTHTYTQTHRHNTMIHITLKHSHSHPHTHSQTHTHSLSHAHTHTLTHTGVFPLRYGPASVTYKAVPTVNNSLSHLKLPVQTKCKSYCV